MSDAPFEALTPSCQEAVEHLRDRCPEAAVVAVHGDWAYVSVGHMDVGRITGVFEQERALAIVRIPKNFPAGERPYGIVTVPHLDRVDGTDVCGQHRSHDNAKAVMGALDVDDVGFWSWRWEGLSHSQPSDLKKAPDLVRRRLRMENG